MEVLLNIIRPLQMFRRTRHADVVVALLAATLVALIDPIIRFDDYRSLLELLPQVGYVKFLGALVLVFAQSVAIFYLVAQFPKIVRLLAMLIIFLIALVQISYFLALSRYMSSTDLFMALTVGMDHVRGAIVSFFNPMAVLWAIPYFIFSSILLVVTYESHLLKKLGVTLSVALFLVASNYAFFVKVNERYFHLNPLTSFIRSALYCQFRDILEYHGPRDELPNVPVTEKPTDSIIYIIDESIRGSHLSLNEYPRPTTPFLQSLEKAGRLRNLGICAAASSYSYIANAYLLSGHNKFPDKDFRTAKNPLPFDYAKKMGYKTIFIDVNGSYLTARTQKARQDSIRSVDLWMTVSDFKQRNIEAEKDLAVARFLGDLLNDAGGYFIVVNKKGLHFPYRTRYPDDSDYQIWQPIMETHEPIDPIPAGREKLVNTYDNGLRFVVDEFFQILVSNTRNQNYIILYTSDHGQTLSEHGQIYTHAKPDKVIADVPEFFVAGQHYAKQVLISGIPDGIRVSHLNNFATLLDLMGVTSSLRIYSYEKSIFELTPEDNEVRFFLNGSLHGLGGNYEVVGIPTPPDEGWGISNLVVKSADVR